MVWRRGSQRNLGTITPWLSTTPIAIRISAKTPANLVAQGNVLPVPETADLRAVDRVYEIKSRSRHKPLSLLIESPEQGRELTVAVNKPPQRQAGQMVGSIEELVEKLATEAKVL